MVTNILVAFAAVTHYEFTLDRTKLPGAKLRIFSKSASKYHLFRASLPLPAGFRKYSRAALFTALPFPQVEESEATRESVRNQEDGHIIGQAAYLA